MPRLRLQQGAALPLWVGGRAPGPAPDVPTPLPRGSPALWILVLTATNLMGDPGQFLPSVGFSFTL